MHSRKKAKKIKLVFCGTPDFASQTLKTLFNDDRFEIEAIITQPDKLVGRKQILSPPDVKKTALEFGFKKIYQPENRLELENLFLDFKENKNNENFLNKSNFPKEFDFLVVIAYGQILSEKVLKSPRIAPINVHGSLLPKYRGASPIQAAILNGDFYSGISIMKMGKKMDAGPVFTKHEIRINKNDTGGILFEKLADLSAEKLGDDLEKIYQKFSKNEKLNWEKQNEKQASYCKKISKNDGEINWQEKTMTIFNQIRAYNPWPIAFTFFSDKNSEKTKKIKIYEADYEILEHKFFQNHSKSKNSEKYNNSKFPQFILENNILKIPVKDGFIIPKKLQIEGKNKINAEDFINGYL